MRRGWTIIRALRFVGWCGLTVIAGLALIVIAGEAYFRLTAPFPTTTSPMRFAPEIGVTRQSNAEMRATNGLEFWTVSRTNSLGFVDREPVSLERAAVGCHVTVIGDSYVEALEVPIAAKFHVRLEERAAQELPELDITTSAFGHGGTGQLAQLAYYDEFARRLRPRLLVLVFAPDDFVDNSPILKALADGLDPDHLGAVSAERTADGTMRLRPPDPDWQKYALPRSSPRSGFWLARPMDRVRGISWLASWLDAMSGILYSSYNHHADPELIARAEMLRRRASYATELDGWRPTSRGRMQQAFTQRNLPLVFRNALAFTAFALDQFKERAARDGAALVILSTHAVGIQGRLAFERLNALARARDIPVIDQHDYIVRRGYNNTNAHWSHGFYWNEVGHLWAAEALLEYLKRHPETCEGGRPGHPLDDARHDF